MSTATPDRPNTAEMTLPAALLPVSLANNLRLSRWFAVHADGSTEVRTGKVELGQGVVTALLQIASDALGVHPSTLHIASGHTVDGPDESWTSSSLSIQVGGTALRLVCTEIRTLFARAAALRLGAQPEDVRMQDGAFGLAQAPATLTYADLCESVDLERDYTGLPPLAQPGPRWVGHALTRLDLQRKLRGGGFVHDLRMPGMIHARVVRPPRTGAVLTHVDVAAIKVLRGVCNVVIDGSFVAVCAEREHDAVRAQEQAAPLLQWSAGQPLPVPDSLDEHLHSLSTTDSTVHAIGGDAPAPTGTLRARYLRPYIAHASIGTCCAVAVPEGDGLVVHTHSQGVYPLRGALATALGLSKEAVTVVHGHGAGCYGHNGADDVALEAALVARATDRPVRLCWNRAEELAWSPVSSAMAVDIEAAADADGSVVHWRQATTSATHLARPGWGGEGVNLLAASQLARPFAPGPVRDVPLEPAGGGGTRNSVPMYGFEYCNIGYRFAATPPLRVSAFRSLGAHANVFAIESMMDELAAASGIDPLKVRLANLVDPRARRVLEAVVKDAAWHAEREGTGEWGWGLAFGRYKNRGAYFAAVVEVEVSHQLRVSKVTAAVDCGLVINPDGALNQVEGGILQAISCTLKEAVKWDADGVSCRDWESYPILRFDEVPQVHVRLVGDPGDPPLGVGECTMGPIAGAIANAISHATGLRAREMPITFERLAALAG
ncbi:xanthine dehydrogenase family protein molybdopterin-binding subunit [Variovorax paradoxus]|nr:molybdopterin cofactor-binding domain-containing protein [Variovorax paradoxus]MBT2305116.1 xanthine dehydrogenase family protein molybdopterin-binding subunit [Variovorax paradoxus]